MKLFEFAVLYHPTEHEEEEQGGKHEIVVPPTWLLAKDAQCAILLAGRAIPEKYLDRIDRLEVLVRPFCPVLPDAAGPNATKFITGIATPSVSNNATWMVPASGNASWTKGIPTLSNLAVSIGPQVTDGVDASALEGLSVSGAALRSALGQRANT